MKKLRKSPALALLLALLLTGCGGTGAQTSVPSASSAPAEPVVSESAPAEPVVSGSVPAVSVESESVPAEPSAPAEPVPEKHPLTPGVYEGRGGAFYQFDREGIVTVTKGEKVTKGAWRTCREKGADCLYIQPGGTAKARRYTYRLTKEGAIRLTDPATGKKNLLTPA